MAITGEQVYNLALGLIDEVSENGSFTPDNPDYYKAKAVSFLTILQAELAKPTDTLQVLTSLSQELSLPDKTCLMVLPYGLAAHLLMSEDQSVAQFLNARYDELKRKIPTSIQPITDVIDVLGGLR